MKIAFVDIMRLPFDGSTLSKRGLGGSESACISMARELSKIGFEVKVFCNCEGEDTFPGFHNEVEYLPVDQLANFDGYFDVVIGLRSTTIFHFPVVKSARHKVLWMHDTFCQGDEELEWMVTKGHINEIFTLSDWHTAYISNCNHGVRRNFEILKPHIYQTRNGINKWIDWVDVRDKDPNLFVFNASVTKGMRPLLFNVWPELIKRIPEAKLTIIGGYYNLGEPDEQEQDWNRYKEKFGDSINFTGVITQQEIAAIMAKASFMLYPCGFPETFGISTLEALAYNTPVITCRYGAMEETAIDSASYKINYPLEQNWAFTGLSISYQTEQFVNMAVEAHANKYLHQQKMYACNAIRYVCEWDTVALQWKQHLYKKLGKFLPLDEFKKVQRINHKVHRTFGRAYSNPEEWDEPKSSKERHIRVVITAYNAAKYVDKCIESILTQDYQNYSVIFVDDCSDDNTLEVFKKYKLPHRNGTFYGYKNTERRGALFNQWQNCKSAAANDIVIIIDGDDCLINNPNIFTKINNLYQNGAEFTYGSCWSMADNIPLIAQEYPPHIKEERKYREYLFNWNMPYTHLRTFSGALLRKIDKSQLKDKDGNYFQAGGDGALFYALIEQADPAKVIAVPEVLYMYNDKNPINDFRVNGDEQTRNATEILQKR